MLLRLDEFIEEMEACGVRGEADDADVAVDADGDENVDVVVAYSMSRPAYSRTRMIPLAFCFTLLVVTLALRREL